MLFRSTLEEIKSAVKAGKKVCWSNEGYEVKLHHFRDGNENWVITCLWNNYSIGLTWINGVTLNGKESEFFVKGEKNENHTP